MMLAAAVLAAAAGAARGQAQPGADDGPIIIGENVGKYNWWDLQYFRDELEFYGEFKRDRQTTLGQPSQKVDEDRLRFTNNLSFESYIGHRNLIDLTGTFKLGFEDQTIESSPPESRINEQPLTDFYDLQALIFGNSRTPTTLYSRRDETVSSREFAGSLRTDTTEHGAIVAVQSESIPSRFQYFHRDQSQSDPFGLLNYDTRQDTFIAQSQAKLTDNQRLEFNYTFDYVDENQQALDDLYSRHDGTLAHQINFGPEQQHNLRSTLRFYDRDGRYEQGILRLDERLVLEHSDTLESRYNLSIERQDRGSGEQRLVSGNATVRHKLFESLVSTATAGGSSFDIPGDFTSTEGFVSGSFDYTKRVPFGRFNAAIGGNFNHQDNTDRGSDIFIINEIYTFNDPFPITIARRNIIPGSIRVTDVSQLLVYAANLDYTVLASSGQVQIDRVVAGGIANGQTVLISYQIGPEPGSRIDTTTQTYSLRYTINEGFLDGVSLYVLHQRTDHAVDAADETLFVLDDISDFRYGVEYRIGDLNLLAEMQNHDSTLSPYDRWKLEARFDRRLARASTLSLLLSHESLDYGDIANRVDLDRAQARWTQRIRSGLDFSAYLQYRDERDDRNGNVRGFEQALEVNWYFRQTKVFGSVRNALLDGEQSDRTSQTFTVGVTRAF